MKQKLVIIVLSPNISKVNLDKLKVKNSLEMVPTLKSKVIFDNSLNIRDVLGYFYILNNEESALM